MLKRLKALFTKQAKISDGKSIPDFTQKITECYADIDTENRWQGDIYSKESFNQTSLPTPNVPYWMLINRTCQLYQGEGREVKLPFLNFITVQPLVDFVKNQDKKIDNAISNLVNDKLEGFVFLPAHPDNNLDAHLVANFNLIHTFQVANSPDASDKLIQLSSPFCEHVFQRFSRYFYTVGYDDKNIKDKAFIKSVAQECEDQLKNDAG